MKNNKIPTRDGDRLRLFSFFGESNGNFSYGIGDYSDYSGGHKKYKFFTNHEDALEFLKTKIINEPVYGYEAIKMAEKYNFDLDKQKLNSYYENRLKSIKSNIETHGEALNKYNSQLEEINKLIL